MVRTGQQPDRSARQVSDARAPAVQVMLARCGGAALCVLHSGVRKVGWVTIFNVSSVIHSSETSDNVNIALEEHRSEQTPSQVHSAPVKKGFPGKCHDISMQVCRCAVQNGWIHYHFSLVALQACLAGYRLRKVVCTNTRQCILTPHSLALTA